MIADLFNPANYAFSPNAIPTLVTTAALLLLGLTVLIRERISPVSVSFFLMTLTVTKREFRSRLENFLVHL